MSQQNGKEPVKNGAPVEGQVQTPAPKKKRKKKRSVIGLIWSAIWRTIGTLFLILLLTGLIAGGALLYYVFSYIDVDVDINLENYKLNLSSFIYVTDSETGETYVDQELYKERREWVDYMDLPHYVGEALVAIEDERFYEHNGVDWKRAGGAVLNMFGGDDSYGGSTITMQLIKNLTGEREHSLMRKVKEWLSAMSLERRASKTQILEYYLNTVNFGHSTYGIQAAAKTYYGVDATELTLAQAASIVGITNLPTYYDPYLNPDNNKERQVDVLWKMLQLGYITQEEYDEAKAEKLVLKNAANEDEEKPKDTTSNVYSYYTDQIIEDVLADLMEQKGYTKDYATQLIFSGGLQIYSAMDPKVQTVMEEVFADDASFLETVVYEDGELPTGAMVVMDPYTGAILGIAGDRGEKTASRVENLATQTYRSPGSTIKPLSVYAPALEYGVITAASIYDDTPFDIENQYPNNYDSSYRGYRGLTTISMAIRQSINTVAMKVLYDLGTQRSYDFMVQNLGFTSLVDKMVINNRVFSDINLAPLSLGALTNGASVREMTQAYCAFPNKGLYIEGYTYTKVLDASGKVVLENTAEPSVAMSEETAYLINNYLQEVVTSGTGGLAQIPGVPTAGKTGTSADDTDRWFMGYTPYYCGGVWFGFAESQKEIDVLNGRNPALWLWKLVMERLHEGVEGGSFFEASNMVQVKFCADSGMLPCEYCYKDPRGNRITTGTFVKGTEPTEPCNKHVMVTVCQESGRAAGPYCTLLDETALVLHKREFPYEITVLDAHMTWQLLPENYPYPTIQVLKPEYEGQYTLPEEAATSGMTLGQYLQSTLLPEEYAAIVNAVLDSSVVAYQNLLTPGTNPGDAGVSNPTNHICQVHTAPAEGETDPEFPSDPEDPVNPDIPDTPGVTDPEPTQTPTPTPVPGGWWADPTPTPVPGASPTPIPGWGVVPAA